MHGLRQSFYHGLRLPGNNFRELFCMDDSHWFFCEGFFRAISREAVSPTLFCNGGILGTISRSIFRALLCSGFLRALFRRGLFRAHFLVCSPCASSQNHLATALPQGFLRCAFEQSLFSRALFTKSFSVRSFAVLFQWVFSRVQPPCKLCNGWFPRFFSQGSFLCALSRENFWRILY